MQAPPVGAQVWSECLATTPTVDRATLCAMVKHLDAGIGRVLDALTAAGVWLARHSLSPQGASATPNTVIIFTTDNGGAFFENQGCNYPLVSSPRVYTHSIAPAQRSCSPTRSVEESTTTTKEGSEEWA